LKLVQSALFAAVITVSLGSPAVAATIIDINYCPGDATCPAGVTEARLTFEDNLLTDDLNDYLVTIKISGDATSPYYVDEVSFKIDSAQVGDYEVLPTLQSAPVPGSPWLVYFDNVSGSANSCIASTGQQQAVCSQSGPANPINYGAPLQGQTLTWTFLVDLNDSEGQLSADSSVNLRAQFLDQNGKNAGILSPVPEPGTLALLGIGASVAAIGRRRARS
jgi:PEP-CTERM motif